MVYYQPPHCHPCHLSIVIPRLVFWHKRLTACLIYVCCKLLASEVLHKGSTVMEINDSPFCWLAFWLVMAVHLGGHAPPLLQCDLMPLKKLASDLLQMPAWSQHLLVADTSSQLLHLMWLIMLVFIVSMYVCRNVGSMILVFLSTAIAESYIAGICVMSVWFSFQDTQAVQWMWYLYGGTVNNFQDSEEIKWSLWHESLYCCSHLAL